MAEMVIGGQRVSARNGERLQVHDPATGELVDSVPRGDAADTRTAIEAAAAALPGWRALATQPRAQILLRACQTVRAHLSELAELLTSEQGKPLREARIEATRCIENIELYAGLVAGGALRGQQVSLPASHAQGLVVKRPIGVVGAIIPWNFPLTLLANKLAPAMAAGNTVVAKPASTTPLATLHLAELLLEGGLPAGVFNVVTGPGSVVGEELIGHPLVRKIGFTGETGTGRQVMARAAQEIKRVTLELGGSDPAVVCADADVEVAARGIAIGRFFNAGQACLAIKRVFVEEPVADELLSKLQARAERLVVGPGRGPKTQMGPLHTEAQRAEIEEQLQDALRRGGRLVTGGKRPEGPEYDKGWFLAPTIVTDVPEGARVWTEETFGPLLPVAVVKDLDEALKRANESEFGLGSSIYTRSVVNAERGIDELEAGYTWVNAVQIAHDELPFGGWKHSGYGKEHGTEVLDFYTEAKSVVLSGGI